MSAMTVVSSGFIEALIKFQENTCILPSTSCAIPTQKEKKIVLLTRKLIALQRLKCS